jgi:hypothetical protein
LVITLAFVAVLTVLLLAFLSRAGVERQIAGASAGEMKADDIAKAGLDIIVTDFRQEIAAGSTVTANTNTAANPWQPIYLPVSANTSVPARILTGDGSTGGAGDGAETNNVNLVRRSMIPTDYAGVISAPPFSTYFTSQYGTAFPTNNLATPNANTYTAHAINGRYINFLRWNQPQLLNDPSDFIYPDWVMVTRNGPKSFPAWTSTVASAAPTNSNYIVGRYAFNVYDEGGLLDINVVGRESAIPTPPVGKTAVATLADLTQLTNAGVAWTASANVPSQGAVDALVKWRNASMTGNFYDASNPGDTNSYFGFVTGTTNSLTQVQPGNQAFLTRQDLINSITSTATGSLGAAGFTTNALPFLATFTRQVNAPSFYPALTNFKLTPVPTAATTDRPKLAVGGGGFTIPTYDYYETTRTSYTPYNYDNQNYAGAVKMNNPALADVRFPVAATLPGFPTNSATYNGPSVVPGEPLLRQRFALSRLTLLTTTAVSVSATSPSDQSDLIYRYFGLTRGTTTSSLPNDKSGTLYAVPWVYNHGGPAGRIMTLQELQAYIAANPTKARDPDFFELLQAAIAIGSLGRDAGDPSATTDNGLGPAGTGDLIVPTAGTPAADQADQSATFHILQIGANIIDQASAEYDPIAISIGGVTVYGQEDLPCIDKVIQFICQDDLTSSSVGTISGYYVFELWNPYQTQKANSTTYPTQFRVSGYAFNGTTSTAHINCKSGAVANQYYSYPAVDLTAGGTGTNYIQFSPTTSPPALNPTFSAPSVLSPTNTASISSPVARNIVSTPFVYAGLYVGSISNTNNAPTQTSPPPFSLTNNWTSWEIDPGTTTGIQQPATEIPGFVNFSLLCQMSNGAWQPYSICRDILATKNSTGTTQFNTLYSPTAGYFYYKLDPRTDRWSSGTDVDQSPPQGSTTKIGYTFQWNPATYPNGYNPKSQGTQYWPYQTSAGFSQPGNAGATGPSGTFYSLSHNNENTLYSYVDADGVVRRGDDMYSTNGTGDPSAYAGFPMNTTTSPALGIYLGRPLMLHRPFQSVAELGYVFRDVAWKSLDFFTTRSGDSALLDVFSAYEEPPVVAGKVDVNTRSVPVLAALLNGSCIDELGSTSGTSTNIAPAEALAFANQIVSVTSQTPLHNKSDLVNRLMGTLTQDATTSSTPNTGDNWGSCFAVTSTTPNSAERARIKGNRESAIRALGEATASRTWNLLIDIIAQSGRYTSASTSFANFTIEGEKRYWLHVAIDRYTGKIVDEQLEPVYE